MSIITLKETLENLKIQAEKARQDLSVFAKEIAEERKEYLATAAENSPEPVKDIVETFASLTDELDVSKVRDFYVGIPYGCLVSAGGFISYMLTGSIPAIRFGIIPGAIATILFLREVRLLSMRPFIANFISTFVSGVVVAFYLYRDGGPRGSNRPIKLISLMLM